MSLQTSISSAVCLESAAMRSPIKMIHLIAASASRVQLTMLPDFLQFAVQVGNGFIEPREPLSLLGIQLNL